MAGFIIIGYGLILLLGVSISGYLSYGGLLQTAGEVTIPLVIFLMGIILVMDSAISFFRQRGKTYGFLVVIWSIAAFFSVSSNFNFLYSTFMREDVTRSTVTEQVAVFRDNMVEARTALSSQEVMTLAERTRTDLDLELNRLYEQINDPLRPGCGEECRGHMGQVERILGANLSNVAVPSLGSTMEEVNAWYQRYRNMAENTLLTSQGDSAAPEIRELVTRIDGLMLEYDTAERVMANNGGLNALARMSELSLDVEREANSHLPEGRNIDLKYIDPTLGRLGEIVYAFENGFVERPNILATGVSLILALVVDGLPFLLSFALFGKGRLEQIKESGPQRGKGGKRVMS